jgi:hypothetical protein
MTQSDRRDELARLRKKVLLTNILEAPGAILIGLAIFGKYGAGASLHPLLNDAAVTTGMIVVGGIIMVWGLMRLFPLWRQIYALERELGVASND